MKRFYIFPSLLLLTLVSFAQEGNWCGTDQMLQQWLDADPKNQIEFLTTQEMMKNSEGENTKAPLIVVPVVVHIIHSNEDGNISKAQIEDGIRALNEDFSKTNADITNVRSVFSSVTADVEIEFRLAKKDPQGNCTEGITRTNSIQTFDAGNNVKSLRPAWNPAKYLNFWVVSSIGSGTGGTTLGFAQFPIDGAWNTYGSVIIHRAWGAIGTSAPSDGGVISHEVGHNFALLHTFQGGCGSFCDQTGDFVCDTPPASGPTFNCNNSLNTCSNDTQGGTSGNQNPYTSNVPNMNENFMSYDDCRASFTNGQKSRMRSTIAFFQNLRDLTSQSNLIATGTNDGFTGPICPPVADIHFLQEFVCHGGAVSFSDNSYGTVSTYEWSFPGGNPAASFSATPTVTYSTPGVYDVTLKVSNSGGSNSITIDNAVIVGDTTVAEPGFEYVSGFETPTVIGDDWIAVNPTGSAVWSRSTLGSFSGVASAFLNNNINREGEVDYLISPPIDLSVVQDPSFEFMVAYKQKSSGTNDILKCAISTDCGQTWNLRAFFSASQYGTGIATNNFVPQSSSDWRKMSVTLTQPMKESKNALFRFEFTSAEGNNIFIDDFKVIGSSVVGIGENSLLNKEFSIYPNPTSSIGSTTIRFTSDKEVKRARLYVTNILGKEVKEVFQGELLNKAEYKFNLETSDLSSGVYFVTLRSAEGLMVTKKLIVSK